MSYRSLAPVFRFTVFAVSFICVCSLPVYGQQPVGPGLLGGSLDCAAGSHPALFDTNHDGPTADDLPAYLAPGVDSTLQARFPTEECFSPAVLSVWDGTGSNPWQGVINSASGIVGGFFEADMADDNGDFVGGSFSQGSNTYAISLLAAPGRAAVYDRVQATGGQINLVGGIQGWDLEPQDGVPDYIGLSWAGLTPFETCDGAPDLDDTMMLWVPVAPYGGTGGEPGAVAIQFDLDCDGVRDPNYPPPPPIIPEDTVPVGLQSFSIAALLPSSPRGYALAILFCAVPVGALRLARRWLAGDGS